MALNKLDKTSEDHKMLETYPDEWAQVLMDLINKVNTGFDKTNEHINKIATEENKVGISTAQANAIVENTAKTGISTAQANAITANTAKTGITDNQAREIAANTSKTGITTGQADAISANTKKTGISTEQSNFITALNQGIAQAVITNNKKVTATVIPRVVIGKTNTLELSVRLNDGSVYATSLTLTKLK